MSPSPWAGAYVGRPWVAGTGECLHRAAEVWADRMGWTLDLAAAGRDPREARRLMAGHGEWSAWEAVDEPEELDAVSMARGRRACHVGVFVAPSHVLHCVEGAGTVLTPLERLADMGLRVTAYHRRRA